MLIGVPKEVKTHEYRVGLVPGSVRELTHHNHRVVVESGAGAGWDDEHPRAIDEGAVLGTAGPRPRTGGVGGRDPAGAREWTTVRLRRSHRSRIGAGAPA